jgi:hypothetical protein
VGVSHFGASHVAISHNVFIGRTGGFHTFNNNFFFHGCFGCFSPFFFNGGFFFGSPFFGFGFGAPFFPYYPYYGGYGGYGYGPYYSQPASYDNSDNSGNNGSSDNTAQLSADVQNLSNQVADLRDDLNSGNSADRAPAPPGTSLSAKDPSVVTVFIFRDGRRISGQNYAIAGETLWIFNEHSAQKFQMADLDAGATEKANAANGVEFHVPEPQDKH